MKVRLIVFIILLISGWSIGQPSDSLVHRASIATGREKVELLHQLVTEVWLNYPDQAMIYAQEALSLSRSSENRTLISKSLRLLAGVHYYKGDFTTSLAYNTQSLEIAMDIQDSSLINNCYNNIGLIYYDLGSYQNSLENLLRSKIIKEAINEVYGMSTTLNNIGLVYHSVGDFVEARENFFEALNLSKQNDEKNQIIYSLNNIGFTYVKEGELILAKEYFDQSLDVAKVIDNKNRESAAWRGLGEIFFINGELDSAMFYYQTALRLRNEIGDQKGVSELYNLMANIEHQLGSENIALDHLTLSQSIARKIGSRNQLLDNLKLFMSIYLITDRKNELYKSQKSYIKLRDSLYYDGIDRNLSLIPLKLKEEANRITLLSQQVQIEKDAFSRKLYIGAIMLGIPVIFILFYMYRKNKLVKEQLMISNMDVTAKNEEILTQKEVLMFNNGALENAKNLIDTQKNELEILNVELEKKVSQRTVELKAANEGLRSTSLELDNLIYKSSHDIRGPLVRLMGVCNLALMEVKEKKALAYFKMVDKASKRLSNIIDKLKIVSELNKKELINEKIDFISLINESLDKNKYIEGLEDVEVETSLEEGTFFYSDPSILDLIIFNMMQNAMQLLKSSSVELKKIKISISKSDKFLVMTFDVENIDLVINKHDNFYNVLSKDDDGQQSLGIGLYTVKQCVQKLEGDLLLMGDLDHITRFTINLPLHIRL